MSKSSWADEFKTISARSAEFGGDFSHPETADAVLTHEAAMVPEGTSPRPSYDSFGAEGKRKSARVLRGSRQAKSLHHKSVAEQAGLLERATGARSAIGAGGGGHGGAGGGSAGGGSAGGGSAGGSGGAGGGGAHAPASTGKGTAAASPAKPVASAGRPAPSAPSGARFVPEGGGGEVWSGGGAWQGGGLGGGYGAAWRDATSSGREQWAYDQDPILVEEEVIDLDDFAGEPEKKSGLPGFVLAILGLLGLVAGAEWLESRKRTPEHHRLSY